VTWSPDPGWLPLASGMGASTGGVWRTADNWVVKRLAAPVESDPVSYQNPTHHAYWRREAEVALSGVVANAPGLRSPACRRVDEDADGIVLWHAYVPRAPRDDPAVAAALGRFACMALPEVPWLCHDQLRRRLARLAERGGVAALGDPAADRLWQRRAVLLERLDRLPLTPCHGDAVPQNLRGRDGEEVVAVDWSGLGVAPLGQDLAVLALSSTVPFEDLLGEFVRAGHDPDAVRVGAVVAAAFTVLTRSVWALGRPDEAAYRIDLQRHADVLAAALRPA
jgi:hypothetical protein